MASKWMIVSLCAVLQPSIWLYGNILLNWKKEKNGSEFVSCRRMRIYIHSGLLIQKKEKAKDI